MIDLTYTLIIAAAPALTAIIGVVSVCLKVIKEIKKLKSNTKSKEEQASIILQENYELKKQINNLNTKLNDLVNEIRSLKRKK